MRLLLTLTLAAFAHTGDGKEHTHELKEPSLLISVRFGMPEGMETALENWDKTFRVIALSQLAPEVRESYRFTQRQAPSVVIGDYNRDQVKDIALLGWAQGYLRLIAVMSAPGGYQVLEIKTWRRGFPEAGEVDMRLTLDEERQVLQLLRASDPAVTFQWKNGKFHQT